ncbi:OLC1v1013599C1 [Oldenlandia corymbosa var. corymbosa]|uniref:OLC1v1013599C1 n=1 Tax=Oldenlandia corymbosa var. corymbosa TaxID=529605 RepID=A0AAV1E0T1_OLDCO|nr:OLC1v1013599C1 [Oldenlandia corymbosa var. corymbosa]
MALEVTFVVVKQSSKMLSASTLNPTIKHQSTRPVLIRLPSYHPSRWRWRPKPKPKQKQKQSHLAVLCSSTIPATPISEEEQNAIKLELNDIKSICKSWTWRGYNINYLIYSGGNDNRTSPSPSPPPPPVLLVHGFGASVAHWRYNIPAIAQTGCPVYAVDLLGFGASDKPIGFPYTMEAWSELILDFINEIIQKPTILVGNSVGSLACVIAAANSSSSVRGLVLLNCAGGMNNKAIVDDWRIKLVLPLLWLIDFLLKQKSIANFIFNKAKDKENIMNVLRSVYGNKAAVDDELVEIIRVPAEDDGALDAFVSIVTGPPGPNPVKLIPTLKEKNLPVLVLWGDEDPFTPIDGPVGKYFTAVAGEFANVELFVLNGVGHCPHDDRPELVHERLLPWLASFPTFTTTTS